MEGKNLQKCLKAHLKILTKFLINLITGCHVKLGKFLNFAAVDKIDMNNMAEIEKEAIIIVNIMSFSCHLVQENALYQHT